VSLTDGARFGPYQITAKIGEGGMGEVYRATDTNLKRAVALKVLPAPVATDPDRLARFQREAELLAVLNHPNIAQIHGLEKADGVTALVMELVDGLTLADRIAEGPIPIDDALQIAKQIAEALEAAHERHIIHRDLKPANIKVRADGTVKVLDFGLAKALDPMSAVGHPTAPTITSPAMMTGIGVLLGTAAYMSPEQARGKPVDRRADIWAFGCVLYEMLTGSRAFEGEDVAVTLSKVLQRDPAFDALPAGVPARVRRTLRLCLEKSLNKRIPDMGAVRLLLEGAFETTAGQPIEMGPSAQPAWRRALPLLLTAIGAAVFSGVVIWRLRPPRAADPQPLLRFALASSTTVAPLGAGVGRHVLAISPQGTHLVYWADNQLYLRAMNRLDEPLAIRGTEDAREPFFSPDGQWIGFQQEGKLKRVSVNGGAPVVLGDARNPWGVSWDIDGLIRYGQGAQGIWQVSASGGTPTRLIAVGEGESAHGPQLLPDGGWILFTLGLPTSDSWDQARIVAQSLETGERIVLIEGGRDARYVPTGHLVYGQDGVLLAVPFDAKKRRVTGPAVSLVEGVMDADVRTGAMHFSVSKDGTLVYLRGGSGERLMLTWVTREGRLEPLPAAALAYSAPRLSRDGTRVAVDIGGRDSSDIHVYDLVRKTLTQITSSPAHGRYPLWTPDSRRVVFYSELDGGGLYSQAADGTGKVERLTTSRALQIPYSWSADGRTLLFEQRQVDLTSPGDVYLLSVVSKPSVVPLVQTPADEVEPVVSPDGRWLAYTSAEVPVSGDAGGSTGVYVRPFPNADDGRWLISTDRGVSPLWSPDGKELFFISRGRAMSVPVETAPTFRPGIPRTMFELPPFYSSNVIRLRRQWDIAPDGKRFLIVNPAEVAAPGERSQAGMVVVVNWFGELRRLVPTK
jgi:eukaryotic-like serine/threonine-protein kinase